MKFIYYHLLLIVSKSSILVGGQAVIEGVMMRVPGAYATSVRDPNGYIKSKRHKFISITDKHPFLKYPILRGIIGLYESMKIGFSTLEWSIQINTPEDIKKPNKFADFFLTVFSIFIALGLFFATPIALTTWLFEKNDNAFIFNLISGIIRIMVFLIYLLLISFMKDIFRLFQYHGAEHKTVYNFESGKKLSIANAQEFPTQHPRCGTSFIFILMMVAIVSFAILDSVILYFGYELTIFKRLLFHIPFIPIVAGMGYEFLKITAKHRNNLVFKLFSMPGIWLQNITTKQPDDEQIQVALHALESAFGTKLGDYKGKTFTAEAIG